MAELDTTLTGAHLALSLVTPTGGGADITLADLAALAIATVVESDAVIVDTIAALQAVVAPADKQLATVRYYSLIDDGGGGLFMYRSTMTTAANGGTIFEKAAGGTGRWVRLVPTGAPFSVRWFGAKGDFSTVDTAAFQSAINAAGTQGCVVIPIGRYLINATLSLPEDITVRGEGDQGSYVYAVNIVGPVFKANDLHSDPTKGAITLANFQLAGNATIGISFKQAQVSRISDIMMAIHTTQDGIYIEDCWGIIIEKIQIYGTHTQSGIHIHRPTGAGGNHAITIRDVYSSSGAPIGILVDSAISTENNIGIHIENCCLQGHTDAAVRLNSVQGADIHALYTESTGMPIHIGNQSTNTWSDTVAITGCTFMTATAPITLDCCRSIAFTGCNFKIGAAGGTGVWLRYKYASNVTIVGCSPRNMSQGIVKMVGARDTSGIQILQGSSKGTPNFPADGGEDAMLVMPSAFNNGRHYKMTVDAAGAWVATVWNVPEET